MVKRCEFDRAKKDVVGKRGPCGWHAQAGDAGNSTSTCVWSRAPMAAECKTWSLLSARDSVEGRLELQAEAQ